MYKFDDTELIKGYKLINETVESKVRVINTIKIEINLVSEIGAELYNTIKEKFKPEDIKEKYIKNSNYVYGENRQGDIVNIEIKIVTDKTNPKEIKAKRKLLQKINKYT